jgi:small subunit ribosomal protein S8
VRRPFSESGEVFHEPGEENYIKQSIRRGGKQFMTMSDPIADMLTRIRNANTAKHDTVDVPSSKMKLAIANILLDEGYIEKYDIVEDGVFKTIHITLKYGADKNEKVITGLRRISKPGLRVYANSADLPSNHFYKPRCNH